MKNKIRTETLRGSGRPGKYNIDQDEAAKQNAAQRGPTKVIDQLASI